MSEALVQLQTQDTDPLFKYNEKYHRRRIFKLSGEELDASLPRFGPLHGRDEPSIMESKEAAWGHVLQRTSDREAITTQVYLSAIRRVEKEARSAYDDDDKKVDILTGSQFRWMMIKDSCFFLQFVLSLLGGSKRLGYLSDDFSFGQKVTTKGWMKSIFCVGNQIPVVVLRVLMKQRFFQEVLADHKGKWERPSDLSRSVLYDLVLLPELEEQHHGACHTQLRSLFRRRAQREPPVDLLHALQFLVLGGSSDADEDEDEGEVEESDIGELAEVDQDLERADGGPPTTTDDQGFSSATELKESGIHFKVLKGSQGSNGIDFKKGWFSAAICLPTFPFDYNTQMIFRSLKSYEENQPVSKNKLEAHSYLRFMSELIQTPEDAQHLASKGIVRKGRRYHEKLPSILKSLAAKEAYNHRFRLLSFKVSNYTRPAWTKLSQFLSFVLFLTFVQTLYAMLAYHHPPK